MALNIKKKAPAAEVTTTTSQKGQVVSEDVKQEPVDVPQEMTPALDTEPFCHVGLETSYTHNLGNYQSMRIQVSLTIPCKHSEIDQVADYVESWVNTRMEKLMDSLPSA